MPSSIIETQKFQVMTNQLLSTAGYKPVLFNAGTKKEIANSNKIYSTVNVTPEFTRSIATEVTTNNTIEGQIYVGARNFEYKNVIFQGHYIQSVRDINDFSQSVLKDTLKKYAIDQERALYFGVDLQSKVTNFGIKTNPNVLKPAEITPTGINDLIESFYSSLSSISNNTLSDDNNIVAFMSRNIYNKLQLRNNDTGFTYLQDIKAGFQGQIIPVNDFIVTPEGSTTPDSFYFLSEKNYSLIYLGYGPTISSKFYDQWKEANVWRMSRTSVAFDCMQIGASIYQAVNDSSLSLSSKKK